MKHRNLLLICALLMLSGCSSNAANNDNGESKELKIFEGATVIELSDEQILVDGSNISNDLSSNIYTSNDIVYYEEGKDFSYGEGNKEDEHSKDEADEHTVINITQAGSYVLTGSLSKGQIAIDLGKDAEEDPNAVVTLILNDVDVTCTVAPAIIFYNVYECGDTDEANTTADVDTSNAGANVIIADDTVNNITGSYVARIYKPESVELNEDKTEVISSKKLHKYDAAFYSKQSMNINGDVNGSGILNINAENEGLDSELHLTINGGNINIISGNDGINTNEDNISVTTMNGGNLKIIVDGSTGEGDGIDSNGWLVINGGTVIAYACGFSMDSGIDSDKGIHINGGTVIATGNMLDAIEAGGQTYAVFSFASNQAVNTTYSIKDQAGNVVLECTPENNFSNLIISSEQLTEGTYTFWNNDTQLSYSGQGGNMFTRPGGMPGNMPQFNEGEMPQFDESQIPEMPNGEFPDFQKDERPEIPQGQIPQEPNGEFPEDMNRPGSNEQFNEESSVDFEIKTGSNMFNNVK